MSRARVPCRGSRVTFFFSNFFFSEKVIIDAINVIKTNKKNLKKQMAREHLLVVVGWGEGGGGGWNREKLRDIPICFRRITLITPRKPIPRTEHVTWKH